jgi:hypothetical protein
MALEESNPKTGSFAFYQKKKASSMTQAYLGDMFKKASKIVWCLLNPCL